MKDNILSLPNDVLGDIFREIYSEYEKSIRSMFTAPVCDLEITAQQVAKAFDKRGLIEYAPQFYIFATGVFIGIKKPFLFLRLNIIVGLHLSIHPL